MADLFSLVQIASMIMFILGVALGELVAYKFFGKPKPSAMIIDLVIFVLVVSLLFNSVAFTSTGIFFYLTNFAIGVVTILLVRVVEYPLGLTEKREESRLLINIIRSLSRSGLDKKEIKHVLKTSGFSAETVNRYDNMIDDHVPRYLTRLVRLEKKVDEINTKLTKKK
jgi:uncharacterized membrane protein YoaK (UPF0700 family)